MMGAASDAKHIRLMVWVAINVVEVKTRTTDPFGNELWTRWRIIEHRDHGNQYEVRSKGWDDRFRRIGTDGLYFASFDEALCEIEAQEAEADASARRVSTLTNGHE